MTTGSIRKSKQYRQNYCRYTIQRKWGRYRKIIYQHTEMRRKQYIYNTLTEGWNNNNYQRNKKFSR